jgi:ABC-type glycerol-3-phosphate transport system substrate-binding protein
LYQGGWVTTEYSTPWLQGGVALSWNGAPNMSAEVRNSQFPYAWDFAMYPSGPKGNGTEVTGQGHVIYSGTKYPEEAWRWIKYIVYDRAVDWTRVNARPTPVLRHLQRYTELVADKAPHQNLVVEALLNPASFYRPILKDARVVQTINTQLNSAFAGQVSLEQAIAESMRICNAILAETSQAK